ncbi:hypothetical protein BJ956_000100 [Arthrobacter psychrochitiniphilus]|nr:hypothetical protein [Arthrobacter psychrochitiniphilus]
MVRFRPTLSRIDTAQALATDDAALALLREPATVS